MKLTTTIPGSTEPFEGERVITVRSLPAGATVHKATATITPVAAPGERLFEERIRFGNGQGDWGATRRTGADFAEVDFHTRRTLSLVDGENITGTNLQVDFGGLFVEINQQGAARAPGDTLYSVGTGGILPALDVYQFRLSDPSLPATTPTIAEIVIRSAPLNLTLALGDLAPFWTHPGTLAQPTTTSDFTAILQAYLPEAAVDNGMLLMPLRLHSDALCRVDVTLEVEYLVEQSLLPEDLQEVNMTFDYAGTPSQTLLVELPAAARVRPGDTTARVVGGFGDSRVVAGPTGAVTPAVEVALTPQLPQAQPVALAGDTPATAVDLLLTAVTRTVSLTLDVQDDADGRPGGLPLLPRPVTVELDRDVAGTPTWISVDLPQEFQFLSGTRYWLVLQALDGEARWSAAPGAGAPGLHYTSSGGLAWRTSAAEPHPTLDAYYRLRHTPARYQVPISLQIGEGESARRVSLERFQALGRVDFDLDFAAVADAFNSYLDAATTAVATPAEHLLNPAFESWYRVGDGLGQIRSQESAVNPLAMAIAPDGTWAYVAGPVRGGTAVPGVAVPEETIGLVVTDLGCHQPGEMAVIAGVDNVDRLDLTFNPAGKHAYLLANDRLYLVDTTRHALIGRGFALAGNARTFAVSPDGHTLYLAERARFGEGSSATIGSRVRALDTTLLAQAARSRGPLETAVSWELSLSAAGDGLDVEALALSADGRRLYVTLDGNEGGSQLRVYDVQGREQLHPPIAVGDRPVALALTADERLAVVSCRDASVVRVVDLLRRQTLWDFSDGIPHGVAVSPDGRRAFVAVGDSESDGEVVVVDLTNRREETRQPVSETLRDIVITPQGDFVYALPRWGSNDGRFFALPVGMRLPTEWTLTGGGVRLQCLPPPYHLVALLGEDFYSELRLNTITSLSQVVPVCGGCRYDFSFWGLASNPGAVAELVWRGDECAPGRIDQIPIEVWRGERAAEGPTVHNTVSRRRSPQAAGEIPLAFHQHQAEAPAGAVQVEVRFVTPRGGLVAVDRVSLQGSSDALANGSFHLQPDDSLAGWTLSPETAPGLFLGEGDGGLEIRNLSAETVTLTQVGSTAPGERVTLTVNARTSGPAQAELHWQTASGATAVPSQMLALAGIAGGDERLQTTVPAGAEQVEVALRIPPGSTLTLSQASLRSEATVAVPVSFVAEAPGELTFTAARVAYDLVTPPPPPPPAGGLCPPTLPRRAGIDAGGEEDCCYCPACQSQRRMKEREAALSPGGQQVEMARCPTCGARVLRQGNQLHAAHRRLGEAEIARRAVLVTPTSRTMRARIPVEAFTREVVLLPPLTAVHGIGPTREQQLRELGIDSLMRLAAMTPGPLARLRGVSLEMARAFIREAQRLVGEAR